MRQYNESRSINRPLAARMLLSVCALVAPVVLPCHAQDQGPTVTCGGDTSVTGTSFYNNFVNTTAATAYEYPLNNPSGANAGGDRNSTYFQMFYSILNANNIQDSTGTPCHFELVLAGQYPNTRYFSVTSEDMHYSAVQHISDFQIDPAKKTFTNPFLPNQSFAAVDYLIPISIGYIPTPTQQTSVANCNITPFEEDNLIDATARHPSMDANTDFSDPNTAAPHVVDFPEHRAPTGASGTVTTTGNTVTWNSGTPFNANGQWSGAAITIDGQGYTIASVPVPTAGNPPSTLTLTTTPSTAYTTPVPYSMPASGSGQVTSSNPNTVTWYSGNPFDTSGGWTGVPIKINGVSHTIASVNSPTSLTLQDTIANHSTSVSYNVPGVVSFGADGANSAGSLTVRSYLPRQTCSGTPGEGDVTCNQPAPPQSPFLIVRDAGTGCAYKISDLITYGWLDDPNAIGAPCQATGVNCSHPSTAIISTADNGAQLASVSGSTAQEAVYPFWNDEGQHAQHTADSDMVLRACYADGNPNTNGGTRTPLPLASQVAWTRGPEWVGSPGPDDSYIGGAISAAALGTMQTTGTTQKLIEMRFEVPNMPSTPCASGCKLIGNEDLRYMSISFEFQVPPGTSCPHAASDMTADPDGIIYANAHMCAPATLISIADQALALNSDGNGHQFADLLVNVGGTLPSSLAQTSSVTPAMQGVFPPTDQNSNYSVWQVPDSGGVNKYTVVDLTQMPNFGTYVCSGGSCSLPLMINLRSTMPNSAFGCSGAVVPFNAAVYTNANGGGETLMGPYLPLVNYANPSNSSASNYLQPAQASRSGLADPAWCGQFPGTGGSTYPGYTGSTSIQWPVQYWPSSVSSATPKLTCAKATSPSPSITYISSQRQSLASAESIVCTSSSACTQVIAQRAQDKTTNQAAAYQWQPAVPIAIEGQGFGFLPQTNLPLAIGGFPTTPASANYLEIVDTNGGTTNWDTANWASGGSNSCQMFISNWTDTNITLTLGIPAPYPNPQSTSLPPLAPPTDNSLLTLFFSIYPGVPTLPCAISAGDTLTFTITNPQTQSSITTTQPVTVQSYLSTTPN